MRWMGILVLCATASADPLSDLSDSDWAVRHAAALSFVAKPDAAAVEPLIELLIDDAAEVRRAAIRALGHSGDRRAGPALRLHFDADRAAIALALVTLNDSQAGLFFRRAKKEMWALPAESLKPCLVAESWHVRAWALRHPGVRKSTPGAWRPALEELALKDPSRAVRAAAWKLLSHREWGAHVFVHLASGDDARDRQVAARALADWADPQHQHLPRLLGDKDPHVRAWAVHGLRATDISLDSLRRDAHAVVADAVSSVLATRGSYEDRVLALLEKADVDTPFPSRRRHLRAGGGSLVPKSADATRDAVVAGGAKAAAAVEARIPVAKDPRRLTFVLGHIGKPAIPALERLRDKGNEDALLCLAQLAAWTPETLRRVIGLALTVDRDEWASESHATVARELVVAAPEPALAWFQSQDIGLSPSAAVTELLKDLRRARTKQLSKK